ncbi:MAG: NAD(P)/FAD-dependent oxidoreductase [Eubacterium sp.]|nr:NAD(P)/FAD-dependent oxidoreductase [Eubacterium sp.]
MKKMIVIGAGAAGLMAALSASERYNVTIIEKNEKAGKKIYITGKGRCNLTNACDREEFMNNVVHNNKFLYSSLSAFDQKAVMELFESLGTPLKVERGNRVFPVSDRASDVTKALTDELKKCRVKILYNTEVREILTEEIVNDPEDISDETENYENEAETVQFSNKYKASKKSKGQVSRVVGVETSRGRFPADVVVVATGGLSYPSTGSTGDGLRFAKDLGLKVTDTFPALCPLNIKGEECKRMMGLSLKNVRAGFYSETKNKEKKNNKKLKPFYEDFGEMLFTHFGVSGPIVLSASNYVCDHDGEELYMVIDLKPALSMDELVARIEKDFADFRLREYCNSLGQLLPRLMIPVIIERSGIKPDKKVSNISADEIKRLAECLKNFRLDIIGLRSYNEAIITRGGVAISEIDPKTMEAKKVEGLRFAGEVIDLDAKTGGFNLQIAWSTGYAAGR